MRLFLQIIPWILFVVLYFPIFWGLYRSRWASIDYTHAYFILPIVLLMVWTKRKEIREKMFIRDPDIFMGLFLFLFGITSLIFGYGQGYLFVQTISVIPVVLGMVIFLYNREVAKLIAFPILYLLLLIPIPAGILDNITLPMRYATAVASAKILASMHYEVIRQGLLLNVNGYNIFMGAPCSGFRSLITMLSLGLIYIFFSKGSVFKNLVLFLSIFPMAFIGNVIRVTALCLITVYFGDEAGRGFFHNFSGIVVFFFMICGMMLLEHILAKRFNK